MGAMIAIAEVRLRGAAGITVVGLAFGKQRRRLRWDAAVSGCNPCMIVDNALYVDGKRADDPHSLHEAHEACQAQQSLAWLGLDKPDEEELATVAEEFGLHELAVEDSVKAHQRPKLERYDGTLFVVLKPARYLDESSEVEFSEAHVFVGHNFVVTVRQNNQVRKISAWAAILIVPTIVSGIY